MSKNVHVTIMDLMPKPIQVSEAKVVGGLMQAGWKVVPVCEMVGGQPEHDGNTYRPLSNSENVNRVFGSEQGDLRFHTGFTSISWGWEIKGDQVVFTPQVRDSGNNQINPVVEKVIIDAAGATVQILQLGELVINPPFPGWVRAHGGVVYVDPTFESVAHQQAAEFVKELRSAGLIGSVLISVEDLLALISWIPNDGGSSADLINRILAEHGLTNS